MGSVNMRAHDHRISIIKRVTSCVAALCIVGMSCVHAQERIGVAAAGNQGTSDLTLDEERKLIESGYKRFQNHTISTDRIGKAQMLLIDGTAFTIGPTSSVTPARFIYNLQTAEGSLEVTSRVLLRLVGGKVHNKTPATTRPNSATVCTRVSITNVE